MTSIADNLSLELPHGTFALTSITDETDMASLQGLACMIVHAKGKALRKLGYHIATVNAYE